jgi:hypothetical protein
MPKMRLGIYDTQSLHTDDLSFLWRRELITMHIALVGTYEASNIIIVTVWSGTHYETRVKGKITKRPMYVAQYYGKDLTSAIKGHNKWVALFGGPVDKPMTKENTTDRRYKISLTALIKILHQTFGSDNLLVSVDSKEPTRLFLLMCSGSFDGNCVYDLATREAFDVCVKWQHLIDESKAQAVDNFIDQKLQETARNAC